MQKPEFTREHKGLTAAQQKCDASCDGASGFCKGSGAWRILLLYPGNGREAAEHGSSFRTGSKAIRIDQIQGFFAAPTGRRAAQARTFQKEREFILQKDVSGTQAIVQGIIDCFFEEEDGMVIIDYKNSYVGSEREKRNSGSDTGSSWHYIRKR